MGLQKRPEHQMEQRGMRAACLVFISSLQSSVIDFPDTRHFLLSLNGVRLAVAVPTLVEFILSDPVREDGC